MFKKLSKKSIVALIGAILYVVLPTDLIPDFIPGFGQVDDVAVIGFVIKSIYDDLKKEKK